MHTHLRTKVQCDGHIYAPSRCTGTSAHVRHGGSPGGRGAALNDPGGLGRPLHIDRVPLSTAGYQTTLADHLHSSNATNNTCSLINNEK